MYIAADSLDDLLRMVFTALLNNGEQQSPSRGACLEIRGALLKLTNPRARLSRSEYKGTIFSCLGELLWYLSKNNELSFIKYYLKKYEDESDDGTTLYGGYGPRLFKMREINQIENVINVLSEKPTSRRAVIQLFNAEDLKDHHSEIPCTCTLQFFVRNKKLEMITYMRSNDAFQGLPHDVFAFTMLQEILARSLNVDVGVYQHTVGSLHLYNNENQDDVKKCESFLSEGYHSSIEMPPMPRGDPWCNIQRLLDAEKNLRQEKKLSINYSDLDVYWRDLIYLLEAFSNENPKKPEFYDAAKKKITNSIYHVYVNRLRDNRLNNGKPV